MRRIATFGALVALVGVLGACSATGGDDSVTVEYFVFHAAGGPVSLTLTNEDGNTEQLDVDIPAATTWNKRLEMQSGDFVSISAQRGAGHGTIRCTINADNERIERAESEGEFVIASCSGLVP